MIRFALVNFTRKKLIEFNIEIEHGTVSKIVWGIDYLDSHSYDYAKINLEISVKLMHSFNNFL